MSAKLSSCRLVLIVFLAVVRGGLGGHLRRGPHVRFVGDKRSDAGGNMYGFCPYKSSVQLVSKNDGLQLALLEDGSVNGLPADIISPYVKFQRISIEPGIILIKGMKTKKYLAIDKTGKTIATDGWDEENYFLERLEDNRWTTFKSYLYENKGWYLGMTQNGKPLRNSKYLDLWTRDGIFFMVRC